MYAPLEQLLQDGARAMAAQDYATAAGQFNTVTSLYSEEPEWTEGTLPRKILPLAGFSNLRAGHFETAIAQLNTLFDEFASSGQSTDFPRYVLAVSYLRNKQEPLAAQTFRALRLETSSPALAGLAALSESKLLSLEEAIPLLQQTTRQTESPRIKTQAILLLVERQMETERFAEAASTLLDYDWTSASMPEIATLSFLAFDLGDRFLDINPSRSLRCYQLVQKYPTLLEKQERRIQEVEQVVRETLPSLSIEASTWADFYAELIANLKGQLAALKESPSYDLSLKLRKARAYANLNRSIESWILLQELSSAADKEIAKSAHLSWINLARKMKQWRDSASIAQTFIKTYPNSQEADIALYWISHALMEQGEHQEAFLSFAKLADLTTQSDLQTSSCYFAGYNSSQLGEYTLARTWFDKVSALSPATDISAQALIWKGLCYLFEHDYQSAQNEFQKVVNEPRHKTFHPEADFRLLSAQFLSGNTTGLSKQLNQWLQTYPLHSRYPEALLLAGDVSYAEGQNDEAIKHYSKVPSERRELKFEAIQKAADILIQQHETLQALDTFERYQASGYIPQSVVGNYFYTLHELLVSTSKPDEARQRVEAAIATYGNEINANGITELLLLPSVEIDRIEKQASEADQTTLAARTTVAHHRKYLSEGDTSRATASAISLATDFAIEDLPPQALLVAGKALAEIQSIDATLFLNKLIAEYPDSDDTAEAFVALAQLSLKEENHQEALTLFEQAKVRQPLAPESLLSYADCLIKNDRPIRAQEALAALLSDRQASTLHRAEALFRLGNISLAQDEPQIAYNYYQRIFTLYRAETNLVSRSYLQSAEILISLDRFQDASSVLSEFEAQPDLVAAVPSRQLADLKASIDRGNTRPSDSPNETSSPHEIPN